MARAPLLSLDDVTLSFGGRPLFEGVSLTVQPGDRIALVGRNGSGKSTLLKIMAGLVEADRGARVLANGVGVAYLPQDPDFAGFPTLGAYAAADLAPEDRWRAEAAMQGVGLDPDRVPAIASGGERRRAALARVLAAEADLLLLDEPTNHLDIQMISWLEAQLAATRAAFVLISHDRRFLAELTRRTAWLDRGALRLREAGFAGFEDWRDRVFAEEDLARHKRDRLIAAEAQWAVEGISARRRRNQGRLRRLEGLRAERRAAIARAGTARMAFADSAVPSGKRVIEAEGIAKRYGARVILAPFDLTVARGDRVAIVGPNGVGKTTLVRLLTGQEAPDQGRVTIGANVTMAVFDQNRAALDPAASLWETLTGDAELGVSGKNDQVLVRGRPRHVVGYLKDFLFDEAQARGPVRALSGGGRARLLLARLMARETNLLVLDEPTNDLDVETLDLLQELVADYPGTVLLVSHDRDFLDRVASVTVLLEGDGQATVYAGGWSDMEAQRRAAAEAAAPADTARPPRGRAPAPEPRRKAGTRSAPPDAPDGATGAEAPAAAPRKLGFRETRRLAALPAEIARLEAEIAKLETALADPGLYARDPATFAKATEALAARQAALAAAEDEWLTLEAQAEAAGRAAGRGDAA